MAAPDAAMAAAFEAGVDVLRGLGAAVEEVRLPVSVAECLACSSMIGPAESASIHERELRESPALMGAALRDKLMAGSMVRAADYLAAQRRRRGIAAGVDALMRQYDAVVTYGALHAAPRLGIEPEMTAFTRDTALVPFSLSGHPSVVQCTGYMEDGGAGLPLNWQIAGRLWDEATVLRVAAAYEAATPWRVRRPEPVLETI
jgi:aspartyl-tRNA(Asn)/glutamyl-tRNA(Gln) amidotransferase subunit A